MSSPMLDVSVVVVTHNRPSMLAALIEAELAQIVQPREIIVIDNGSDEATPQVLARYAGRVVSKRVSGLSRDRSRNLGIETATAAWISPIDDDDYHCPEFLERVGVVIADGRATLIGTDYQPFDEDGIRGWTRFSSMPDGFWGGIDRQSGVEGWTFVGKFAPERLLIRNILEPGQLVVSRDLLGRAGAFDVDFPYTIGEMFELNARLLEQAELALIWQPLLMYRQHAGSTTRVEFDSRYLKLRTFEYIRDKHAGRSASFDYAVNQDITRRRRAVFAQAFAARETQKLNELYVELLPSERTFWRRLMNTLPTLPDPTARFASWFVPRASRRLGWGQDFDLI